MAVFSRPGLTLPLPDAATIELTAVWLRANDTLVDGFLTVPVGSRPPHGREQPVREPLTVFTYPASGRLPRGRPSCRSCG
jgi:hypothetical protein